jgi:hypothetical protein
MAVDLIMLKTHIAEFKEHIKHINEKKNVILDIDVELESAFDTLKDHWRTGGFEPKEMSENVDIIKRYLKTNDKDLNTALKKFSSYCEIYYIQDEDKFEAFQAIMQNKKPLDNSIIQRIYVKEFGNLPEFTYFDEIHKKTNGNTIYELFNFEPDTFTFRVLRTIVNDKDEFRKHPLSKKGKWEDFNLFANILKDEKIRETYDSYYRFLRCKKIFKVVHRRNKNLVSKDYIDVVGELEKYQICEDSKRAEDLIIRFCKEIGLTCIPTTSQQVAEDERRTEYTRKRIEETINQLKKKQKELESSLYGIGKETDSLFSSIDTSISEMSATIKNIKNNSEAIYNEEDKIKELEKYVDDLQKLKQKIKDVENSRNETSKFIEREVKDADDKQNEITFHSVNNIFSDVSSKDAVIRKRYNEFIDKYNDEIIMNVQPRFTESKSRFYNKEKEIKAERERIKKKISEERKNLKKPITKIYVWIQIILLITFFVIYIPLFSANKLEFVFFCLNAMGFIGYIILSSKQFIKYNKIVETINEGSNKKEKYRSTAKLIGNIIWACIFFVSVQFCFLIMKYIDFSMRSFSSSSSSSSPSFSSGRPTFFILLAIIFIIIFVSRNKTKNKL